ncbi:MAG: methionyl-tRNA formyltransferase [Burkholderiaceae bacterium]|nr:methionyl-tRNA formyltransferase [Burkholderiaceae bacterium]MCD8515811.1 methionyl-tRNA formyltransferase [Burkholderiaceae bacterium]MCD8564145.1 methionyl-tRNA formyltransferase [Burkholderiaceae bacterium]
MRIGFAGTPAFAQTALEALIKNGFEVVVVLTQPDRPAGRGMKLTASPVKQTANEHHIPVLQPRSLRLDGRYPEEAALAKSTLDTLNLDVLIVAAYGLILPKWVLDLPKRGCLNIHASLLPRWRGAAPIQRAIEAGDAQTGITIMQMDEGLDTGAMLMTEAIAIDDGDNAQTLHDKLSGLGAKMIVQALAALERGNLVAVPQPEEGITYAHKIEKAEGVLDFSLPAPALARRIRALNPFPGATVSLPGITEPVKVWGATALDTTSDQRPGTVVAANNRGIDLACVEGTLRLLELQRPGSKRQPVSIFMQSYGGSAN